MNHDAASNASSSSAATRRSRNRREINDFPELKPTLTTEPDGSASTSTSANASLSLVQQTPGGGSDDKAPLIQAPKVPLLLKLKLWFDEHFNKTSQFLTLQNLVSELFGLIQQTERTFAGEITNFAESFKKYKKWAKQSYQEHWKNDSFLEVIEKANQNIHKLNEDQKHLPNVAFLRTLAIAYLSFEVIWEQMKKTKKTDEFGDTLLLKGKCEYLVKLLSENLSCHNRTSALTMSDVSSALKHVALPSCASSSNSQLNGCITFDKNAVPDNLKLSDDLPLLFFGKPRRDSLGSHENKTPNANNKDSDTVSLLVKSTQ